MSEVLEEVEILDPTTVSVTGVGIIITVGKLKKNVVFIVENTSKSWKLEGQTSIPFETLEDGEEPVETASRGVSEELGIVIPQNEFTVLGKFSLFVESVVKTTKIAVVIVHAHVDDISIINIACDEIQEKGVMPIDDMISLGDENIRPCVQEAFTLLGGGLVPDVKIKDLTIDKG